MKLRVFMVLLVTTDKCHHLPHSTVDYFASILRMKNTISKILFYIAAILKRILTFSFAGKRQNNLMCTFCSRYLNSAYERLRATLFEELRPQATVRKS